MIILIKGTPGSGKSKKAESLALELSKGKKKYYIATMIPYGSEGAKRVEKHRKQREGKGFVTVEKTIRVHELVRELPDIGESTCLLECMSNLIGNEMHEGKMQGEEGLAEYIIRQVSELTKAACHLVIVTNTFPLEGEGYDDDTRRYVRLVSLVNEELSKISDKVYEVGKEEMEDP